MLYLPIISCLRPVLLARLGVANDQGLGFNTGLIVNANSKS